MAKCAKTTMELKGILIQHRGGKSNYANFFGTMPKYLCYLHIFGEIGIVMTPKQEGHKSNIENKGKEAIFVGYSNDQAGDVCRFFNLASKQIKITRDVRWTGKFCANGKYVSIPNYNQNTTLKISGDMGQIEEITQEIENDPVETENQNDNIVCMTYDPTSDDMSEILLVGETDESYKSLETFEKVWSHENDYLRSRWREAIKKEVENIEINKVWRITTKDQVPADWRLLGTTWVFKVKKNGIVKARLVAQGFKQIPGIDFTDNFSSVISKTTFRAILVFWAM